MGVDSVPPVDRAPARLRDEPGTPAVERQQRPPPTAPSREDRWERSDAHAEDEPEAQPPPESEEEEQEGEVEDGDPARDDDNPKHLDARA